MVSPNVLCDFAHFYCLGSDAHLLQIKINFDRRCFTVENVIMLRRNHEYCRVIYLKITKWNFFQVCAQGVYRFCAYVLHFVQYVYIYCIVVCFIPGISPASEFYMLTFRNTLPVPSSQANRIPTCLCRWKRQSVPKRRHIKFRSRGIAQKKTYNIQNTAKVLNQEYLLHYYYYYYYYYYYCVLQLCCILNAYCSLFDKIWYFVKTLLYQKRWEAESGLPKIYVRTSENMHYPNSTFHAPISLPHVT